VPLAFDQETIASIRKGSELTLTAVAYEGGQHVQFKVSLKGLASALDRTAQLLGS
jgi:invasion protein IalB